MSTTTERPAARSGVTRARDGTKDGRLVLASASPARRHLLEAAGLEFEVMAADIDERLVRDELLAKGRSPGDIARALARAKAEEVAARLGGRPGGGWLSLPPIRFCSLRARFLKSPPILPPPERP